MEDLSKFLKDAAYIGIGFTVLAFQRAQVQRQEIMKQLDLQLGEAKGNVAKLSESVEDRVKLLEERFEDVQSQFEKVLSQVETSIDKALDEIGARLPESARDLFASARTSAREATSQLRSHAA